MFELIKERFKFASITLSLLNLFLVYHTPISTISVPIPLSLLNPFIVYHTPISTNYISTISVPISPQPMFCHKGSYQANGSLRQIWHQSYKNKTFLAKWFWLKSTFA